MDDTSSTRLNKHLALHLGVSRRQADELIEKGRVTVNDVVAQLGAQIGFDDTVVVSGKPLDTTTEFVYLLLNKPVGYVSSRRAQGGSPTLYELLPKKYHTLKTVGRLDRNSSGLIILTNDGDFAQRMTHPSYQKVKQYTVALDKALEPLHQQMISDFGVDLEDGKSKLALDKLSDDRQKWQVTMSEGRNRQIRRTFSALGYEVTSLHRTAFGSYGLEGLLAGEHRLLAPNVRHTAGQ